MEPGSPAMQADSLPTELSVKPAVSTDFHFFLHFSFSEQIIGIDFSGSGGEIHE